MCYVLYSVRQIGYEPVNQKRLGATTIWDHLYGGYFRSFLYGSTNIQWCGISIYSM